MKVRLEVFDQRGTKVAALVDESLSRGEHEVMFDATRYASGTYLYRLEADGETKLGRMELTK